MLSREKTDLAAGFGDLVHHWIETGDAEPEWASEKDRDLLGRKLMLSGTRREKYWRLGDGEHEVTFAIHLETAQLRMYRGARELADWWKAGADPKEWLTGTVDWLHWGGEKTVPWIDDLKTGRFAPLPKKSKQLRSYALVPWIKAGMPLKYEVALSITHWEKYPLNGRPKRKAHRVSGLELMEHLEDVRFAVEHPSYVNSVPSTTKVTPWGDVVVDEMSPCAFCDCQEPHQFSSWMENWRYRRFMACIPGMIQRVDWTKPIRDEDN